MLPQFHKRNLSVKFLFLHVRLYPLNYYDTEQQHYHGVPIKLVEDNYDRN